jgi:anti-sigma-K factor RskA
VNPPEELDLPGYDDEGLDALLESFVDETLTRDAAIAVQAAAAADPVLAERIRLASAIRDGLSDLETPECPPEVLASVVARAHRDSMLDAFWRGVDHVRRLGAMWKPALVTAALVIAIALSARVGVPEQPAVEPEVAVALEQVKWALGLLSDVGDITAEVVRTDVVVPHVVEPMQRAMSHVFEETPTTYLN